MEPTQQLEINKNLLEEILQKRDSLDSIKGPVKEILNQNGALQIGHDSAHDSVTHDASAAD